jgi:nucleoside-diphosphate-sugar epimerase
MPAELSHRRGITAVTGADGFVGRALCRRLAAEGVGHRALVRTRRNIDDAFAVGEIGPRTDWARALGDVDTIVHCAARAHVLHETAADPLAEYRRVNVAGTRHLAEQAAASGVRRFVYLSSIGVHGVHTNGRGAFRHDDEPAPVEPYAVSKLESEQALRAVADSSGLEFVIVRPTLVYGPGVGANFLRLVRLVERGWALPFGAICNRRSFLSIDNLVDLLVLCARSGDARGRTFLAADGEDVTLPDMVRTIARGLGRPARMFRMPPATLLALASLAGKSSEMERLTGALEVDIEHTRSTLGWRPPVRRDDALLATARWYRDQAGRKQ